MATIIFYEKPGCKGNLRQKALLAAAGHTVQAKSLKTEAWTADRLLMFLGKLPVTDWFNRAAPDIKSGEIVPENLGFEDALHLLLDNPLLIRRPLMELGEERVVGFDIPTVDAWIGLNNIELPEGNIEACVHDDVLSPSPSPIKGRGEHEASHGSCGNH